MTYPYGTKGAPTVGNGLGGLPRRAVAEAAAEIPSAEFKAVIFSGEVDANVIEPLTNAVFLSFSNIQIKIDYDGTIIWQKNTTASVVRAIEDGSSIYSLMNDNNIRLYDSEMQIYSASIRPHSTAQVFDIAVGADAVFAVGTNGASVGYIHKINKALTANEWTRQISSVGNSLIRCVIATSDGGCLVGGYVAHDSISLFGEAVFIKISADGTQQWSSTFAGGSNRFGAIYSLVEDGDFYYGRFVIDTGGGYDRLIQITKDGATAYGCTIGDANTWSFISTGARAIAVNGDLLFCTNGQVPNQFQANTAILTKNPALTPSNRFARRSLFQIDCLFPFSSERFPFRGVIPYRRGFAMIGRISKQFDTSFSNKGILLFADFSSPSQFRFNMQDNEFVSSSTASRVVSKSVVLDTAAVFTATPITTVHTFSNVSLTATIGGTGSSTTATTQSVQEILTQ